MPGFDELCRRLRFLFRRRQFECDLEEEMRFHLEMKARESGSMAAARRQFGNATLLREDSRSAWGWTWLEAWIADFKYAARSLAKNPGFAAVAVLTMALGIGANASIFSLVHAVLLRPLPFPEPGRLVRAGRFGAGNYGVSMPELAFWKENSRTLASVAGYRGASPQGLQFAEATDTIRTLPVTSDFLRTLAVPPALGREFRPEEMRPNGPRTIILSDALWRRRFGADRSVAGHSVVLDGTHYTVAGVLPPGFWFPGEADALVPIRVTGSLQDQGINTDMIARLRPGISLAKAQAEMATLSGNYRRLHPVQELNALTVDPFQDSLVGGIRSSLWLLFGATGLLLLIACTNLAGLLLARLAFRQKEIAMRMALGSGTGRLLRQFVAENLLLTTLGGVASLLAAYGLLGGFVALVPFYLPVSGRLAVDLPVLGFTLAVVAATSLVFSFVPFVNAANLNVNETLKASGRAAMGSGRTRTRDLLVVGETALSVSLLLAAALLIQSVYRLHQVRLGFDPHGVTTFFTPVTPQQQRHPAELRALQAELLDRLRATPGVRFAAAVNRLPLTGQGNLPAQPQGHPERPHGGSARNSRIFPNHENSDRAWPGF
jgi:predicted permease